MTLAGAEGLQNHQENLQRHQAELQKRLAKEEIERQRLITEVYDLTTSMLQEYGSLKDGVLTLEVPVRTRGILGGILGLGRRNLQQPMIIRVHVYQDGNAPFNNDLGLQKEALKKGQLPIIIRGLVDEEFEGEVRERKIALKSGVETRSKLLIIPLVGEVDKFTLDCFIQPRILSIGNGQFNGETDAGSFRQPKLNELKAHRDVLAEYQRSMLEVSTWEAMALLSQAGYPPFGHPF